MLKLIFIWLIIGFVVSIYKVKQSQKFGFDRKVNLSTLPYFVLGVIIWPVILLYILNERKMHKDAYIRAQQEKSDFDREMDELEKDLE